MKLFSHLSVVALGVCLAGVGCKTTTTKPMADSAPSVSDLNTAPAPVPAYTPPTPVEPAVTATPTLNATTPAVTATPTVATAGGSKYTVKKGDTLWKIAVAHYGDGKSVKKIVAANPGLEPDKLKAGQSITLP